MRSSWVFLAFAAGILGCGQKAKPVELVEAEGVVTINGQPLPNAQVTFTPTADVLGPAIATGVTDDKGHFRLTCNGQSGAAAGENMVTIKEGPTPDEVRGEQDQSKYAEFAAKLKNRPIPGDYGNPAKTPLRVTVKAGQKEYPLELVRAAVTRPGPGPASGGGRQ
jgi:hypothetical protein